ncbi:hypothetical protein AB0945_30835 [Streptomyces sp. NPDC005474]|uniref:hypothetical protein n=1 Tax=Streptomyces sp. NPDC005474 TaxID=3154878 RepID=UPI003456CEC3
MTSSPLHPPTNRRERLKSEAGAKPALAAFEFDGFRFGTDSWEFTEYDYRFIHTCQALAWTIAQYDAALVPTG